MVTLDQTVSLTREWAINRLHTLCDTETDDLLELIEDAHSLQCEFSEWLNPEIIDHEIYSLEYLGND
mgnify:FL=1